MANNIAVSVTADVGGLVAGMAVAKEAAKDYGKEMRALARAVKDGDTSQETKARLFEVSEAYAKATATAALYDREIRKVQTSNAAANDNAGQLRAGMQSLGFQLQDVAVQFASGQRAGTIFAQQLPQVAGALTQIAQAGGNTAGVLGRFATFMSGPWGVAVGVAAAVLPPLIAKLWETADAAKGAEDALDDLIKKRRENAAEATKTYEAEKGLNALIERRAQLEAYIARQPRNAATGQPMFAYAQQKELQALNWKIAEGQAAIDAANYKPPVDVTTPVVRPTGGNSAGRVSTRGSRVNFDAEREAEAALRAEIAANRAANQQIESLAEDRFQTEAELSKIALRSKIDDIEAAQRAGEISGAQAIEAKAAVDAQIASRDAQLQAKLFSAKIDQLNADRRNYKIGTEEYANYTRQIELLQQQHLNRQLLNDANARERERQARRQAQEKEKEEQKRAEDQKRASVERTVGPFAQSLARMITLQRGFMGTMRDLWGNIVNLVEQNIARMVQNFIVGLFVQEAAQEASSKKTIFAKAKEAAANAWNAVVGIPIIGPVLAPAAAAASFAGVMAFASAEDGWDVPGGGGAGIDGRGGRPAIIHPREMVLPAQIADSVRALPGGLAAAASLRGASASVADINTGALDAPRIRGGGRAGSRRARSGGGAAPMNITIQTLDARSFERFAKDNKDAFGKAVKKYARNGGR